MEKLKVACKVFGLYILTVFVILITSDILANAFFNNSIVAKYYISGLLGGVCTTAFLFGDKIKK